MALPTLSITDFTGSILVNWQTARFAQYLAECYPRIVRDCIGGGAYADIVASTKDKWADLFSGGAYVLESDKKTIAFNEGLTSAVKYFIWHEFVTDRFVPTNNGINLPTNENSKEMAPESNARLVQMRYNKGVSDMRSVANFVYNYINFKQAIDAIVSNGGNSYTVQTDETKYLYDGDTVTIAGAEYVVSNVVDGVSFDIESDTLPDAYTYTSNPFDIVVLGMVKAMV